MSEKKTLKSVVLEAISAGGAAGTTDSDILALCLPDGTCQWNRDQVGQAIRNLVSDRRAVRMEDDPHAEWWKGIKRFRLPHASEVPDPAKWKNVKKTAPAAPAVDDLPDIVCPTCDHVLTDADLGRLVRSGRLGLVAAQEPGGDAQ